MTSIPLKKWLVTGKRIEPISELYKLSSNLAKKPSDPKLASAVIEADTLYAAWMEAQKVGFIGSPTIRELSE